MTDLRLFFSGFEVRKAGTVNFCSDVIKVSNKAPYVFILEFRSVLISKQKTI